MAESSRAFSATIPVGQDSVVATACGCPKPGRGWSGCVSVLVDESAASGGSSDAKLVSVGVGVTAWFALPVAG